MRRAVRRSRGARRTDKVIKLRLQHRNIPAYDLLEESALTSIEEQADWILDKIGIEFRGDQFALDLFVDAGARVKGERITFEPGHVRQLCSTAPSECPIHAWDPANTIIFGGDNVALMLGYGSPFVSNLDNDRRYSTLEDFRAGRLPEFR